LGDAVAHALVEGAGLALHGRGELQIEAVGEDGPRLGKRGYRIDRLHHWKPPAATGRNLGIFARHCNEWPCTNRIVRLTLAADLANRETTPCRRTPMPSVPSSRSPRWCR